MLTIWGRLNSHNVKKVAWFAEELGIDHVRHDAGGAFGFPDNYQDLNPNKLVPTIDDDGFVLWESGSILRYLAARHPDAGFWIEDPAKRAAADKWIDWHMSYARAQQDAFINLVRTPVERRDAEAIARSAEASGAMMEILDAALSRQPWLSGDQFGIGDIPMGVFAYTWFTLDIPRPDVSNVADWYSRLKTRPAYASQVMIPLS